MKFRIPSSIITLFTLLLCCLHAQASADIKYRSGSTYQIRSVCYPTGCLAPNPLQLDALILTFHDDESAWWDISTQKDGTFTIRNHKTRQYLTFHGERSEWLRYIGLTAMEQAEASHWRIEAAQEGFLVTNVKRSEHWLNVRPRSFIVGTYVETKSWPDDNELFFLVNRKGQVVTLIGDLRVNLSETCCDDKGKAPSLVSPQNVSVPTSHVQTTTTRNNDFWKMVPQPGSTTQTATMSSKHSTGLTVNTTYTTSTATTDDVSRSLQIDGQTPVHDKSSHTCFFTLPKKYMTTTYAGQVKVNNVPKGTVYYVDGKKQGTSGHCNFGTVTGGKRMRLTWTSPQGDSLGTALVSFTFLPMVQINASSISNNGFRESTFQLTSADGKQCTPLMNSMVRYRGEYTFTFFSKKSFALKLKDTEGKKKDLPLLGMRNDNYWILDAMPNDPARFRNRLSQDLWLEMASRPYFKPENGVGLNGVRGQAVEVFLNGKYEGLYFLTERMDRKQFGLSQGSKGNGHGCLYKGNQWNGDVLMTYSPNMVRPSTEQAQGWNGWEIKYPEPSSKHKADWTPLINGVVFTRTATDEEFKARMDEVFDVPVMMDYYLFMSTLFALDNTGKNMYWAVGNTTKSNRLTIAPWDLDATMGMRWDGSRSSVSPTTNYADYLTSHNIMHGAFLRISKALGKQFNVQMATRYKVWRSSFLTIKHIMGKVDAYYELLRLSGADKREQQRWNNHGCSEFQPSAERERLNEWFTQRLNTLDKAILGK